MSAVIVLAAPAHADSDDDVFLKAIHGHGPTNSGGDQQLIKLSHMPCDLLGQDCSMNALARQTRRRAPITLRLSSRAGRLATRRNPVHRWDLLDAA
jgi:hypothetical protein